MRGVDLKSFFMATFLMCVTGTAVASAETLTFRNVGGGNIVAIINGISDGIGCAPEFGPAASIQVSGATVTIASNSPFYLCTIPRTPHPYQVIADLGVLTGDSYTVTWTDTGGLSITAVLVPSALADPSLPVPATAPLVLIITMLGIALLSPSYLKRLNARVPSRYRPGFRNP